MTGFSRVSHSHSLCTWKYSWSCCRDMSCLGSKFLSTKESLLHLAAWVPCAVANDRNCNGHSGKGRLRTLDMAEARKLPYSLGMPRRLKLTLPNTFHSSWINLWWRGVLSFPLACLHMFLYPLLVQHGTNSKWRSVQIPVGSLAYSSRSSGPGLAWMAKTNGQTLPTLPHRD